MSREIEEKPKESTSLAQTKIYRASQETSQARIRPSGIEIKEAAQAIKPQPKHRETAHIARILVSGAKRDTVPKCSAIRGTVNTITAADPAKILTG